MAERSVLFDVKLNIADLEKNAKEASERLKVLKTKQKELKDSSGTNTLEYAKLSNEIRATSKQLKDNASAIEINERLNKKNTGSLAEMREALKAGSIAYANLSKEQQENDEIGGELQRNNLALKKSINEIQEAQGNYTGSVGDYEKATRGMSGTIELLNKTLSDLKVKQEAIKNNPIGFKTSSSEAKDLDDKINKIENSIKGFTNSSNDSVEAIQHLKSGLKEIPRETIGLKKASKEVKDFEKSIEKSNSATSDMTNALDQIPGATGQATNSIKSMSASLKALLANPVVLVIAGIVGVLATLYKSFTKTEEGGNKMNKLFTLIGGLVSSLMKAIRPFAEFLVNNLVKAFETVSKGIDALSQSLASTLDFLGFESMAKGIRDTNEASKELLKTTNDIANREAELVKLRREQRKIQLQYQLDAEKLRQIRDDEARSMEERYKANEDLGKLLAEQSYKELSIAQKELDLVNKKIDLEGESTELLDARAEAELQIIDIQERIAGQQSEQLVNINSLRREEESLRKERIQKTKEANEKLIALQNTLTDIILDNEDKTNENQLAIIESKYEALFILNKNNTDALIELEKQKNEELTALDELQKEDDLTRLQVDLDRELKENEGNLKIQAELKKSFELDKAKIENDFATLKTKRDNELIDKEKQHNLDRIANEQKTADELALINAELNLKNSAGLSNEQQMFKAFQDEKIRIIRENAEREIELNNLVGAEADKVRAKALLDVKNVEDQKFTATEVKNEKELTAEQLKLQKQTTVALNSANQLSGALFQVTQSRLTKELNLVTENYNAQSEALNKQLEDGLITENEYLTQKANIDKQFKKQESKLKEEQFKKQKQADLISSIINTAVGVTQAIPNVPLMAIAGILGATQTALIASQPVPKFAKGGVFGGNSHANGGTKGVFSDGTKIEVEKDEAFFVLNKKATQKISALSNLNQSTGGVPLMASGGAVNFNSGMSASVVASNVDSQNNMTNQMLSLITNLPTPVVAVQDINNAQNSLMNVVNFASF